MFKEVKRSKKLYMLVVEQIISLIDSEQLKCEDRLPSERELSNKFGLSRSTIREAISALEIMGIVEVKPGLGTFVKECEEEDDITELTENDGISPTEIFEARIILEPQIAKLASQRATKEDLNMLKEIVEQTSLITDDKIEEFELLDERFHLIIANASYNDVLIKISLNINNLRNSKLWGNMKFKSLKKEGRVARYKKEHEDIYKALINRDYETVESLTKKHLVDIKNDIFENLE